MSSFVHQDRKYFDSGDYALSKAGVGSQNAVGTAIPNPEKYITAPFPRVADLTSGHSIPHASPHATHQILSCSPVNSTSSPVRESALSQSETSLPDDREQPFPPAESTTPSTVDRNEQVG
jgi:hypothetical protein